MSEAELACGRDPNRVWENATRPPDAHEQGCVVCQRMRRQASLIRGVLAAEAVGEDVQLSGDGEGTPSLPALTSAPPMPLGRSGRADLSRRHEVARPEGDRIEVRETVVSTVVRHSVCDMEDLRVSDVHCRGHGNALHLRVDIEVTGGCPAAQLAGTARQRILTAMTAHLGSAPQAVDICVEDLHV